ncbi:hypothetical protein BGI41_00990 [Methanobrevibacter sp. 87.7]|uniref:hypothetical protein n=1 Tax=Methanobrevibacter sp. 87.7 TaxID=387957 RepID=UPI000B5016A4|nr:hypothetical protein [Methanobrevibacter sp. 87.7]OWT33701.1 hypothetical protein BGI41_00990 [Methanobrevibacter sp. 87.7]
MKWKTATIMSIILYFLVYICSNITNGAINVDLPIFKTYMPVWVIFWSLVFGIIYIRGLPDNELAEGLVLGVYFIIISMILDIFKSTFISHIPFTEYVCKIAYIYLFYPIITTSLGYMASFEVQL